MSDTGEPVGRQATTPTDIPRRGWVQIAKRVVGELREDHVSLLAAGVAFKTLLALFPALIAAISIWGLLADPQTITQRIGELTEPLPEEAASIIEEQMVNVAGTGTGALSGALIVALALALWSASAGVVGLMEGCNAAYDEVDRRSFVRRRGLALAFTVGMLVFFVLAVGIIAVVPVVLGGLGLGAGAEIAVRILQWPLLALLAMVMLALVYRYAPDRDEPRLRWTTGGAALATVLWLVASVGFTIYVETAGNFAATYGALAGIIVLMLWLYLTAFAILIGAEFNAESERQTAKDSTVGPPQPMGHRGATVADNLPADVGSGADGRRPPQERS